MDNKNKAYILYTDGTKKELEHQPTLKEAQEIVGGYIELVPVTFDKNKILVVNEEGIIKKLPYNQEASEMFIYSPIVGNAIVLEGWKGVK